VTAALSNKSDADAFQCGGYLTCGEATGH